MNRFSVTVFVLIEAPPKIITTSVGAYFNTVKNTPGMQKKPNIRGACVVRSVLYMKSIH